MPKEYEPRTFSRAEFPTVFHYREHIKSLTYNPHEMCMDFCREKLEHFEQETPRIHTVEVYREFCLWSQLQEKVNQIPSRQTLSRFVNGMFGKPFTSYYPLTYYKDLAVNEPLSQGLVKLYELKEPSSPLPGAPLEPKPCPKCGTLFDYMNGESLPCLVCNLADTKEEWKQYHYLRTKQSRIEKRNRQVESD
jgi:hypothetical protein